MLWEARTFEIPAGHFFRIICVMGPRWEISPRLRICRSVSTSGKTRALHGTHLDRRSTLIGVPHLHRLATITADTLDWYGFDEFGAGVHDVLSTAVIPTLCFY